MQTKQSTGPTPDASSWQRISTLIEVTVDGGTQIGFYFGSPRGCFLIDDARLYVP